MRNVDPIHQCPGIGTQKFFCFLEISAAVPRAASTQSVARATWEKSTLKERGGLRNSACPDNPGVISASSLDKINIFLEMSFHFSWGAWDTMRKYQGNAFVLRHTHLGRRVTKHFFKTSFPTYDPPSCKTV
jgi:hypothetical protein